jgi:precorrin-6A synthase
MRKILVIGIGAGHPDHITVQAIKALAGVDVVFTLDKGADKQDLVRLRKELCDRYIENRAYRLVVAQDPVRDPSVQSYTARVQSWHEERARLYEQLFIKELGESECGAILVWGDPSLYDSTLRILERVRSRKAVDFDYEVIPGITSVQALAARHRIPLHSIGEPVHITTGRRLDPKLPDEGSVVVMLDGEQAFQRITDEDVDIYWGANLGTASEILRAGKLHEKRSEIERSRAKVRAEHGWIMDVYLLRKNRSG